MRHRESRAALRSNLQRNTPGETPGDAPDSEIPTAELVEGPPGTLEAQVHDTARRAASFQARIVLLENEVMQARKEALDANVRASSLARQLAELAPALKRLSALEADLAKLHGQIEEAGNRNRQELRQSLDTQRRVIFSELEAFRNTVGTSEKENTELVSSLRTMLEQLDQAAARSAEADRRIAALEKGAAPSKANESGATDPPSPRDEVNPSPAPIKEA